MSKSPIRKTIAQSTFKTHWSRYMREVASGEAIVRVKDQTDSSFLVACQRDDAPDVWVAIAATEAKERLSDIFAQVKSGVVFRVENKRGGVVYLRPFRGYDYPLAKAVRKYWEDRLASELTQPETKQTVETTLEELIKSGQSSLEGQVEKLTKLVRHVIREGHGLQTYTADQIKRDAEGDDLI
jgi:antitoxin (DNA-binding transcriptional repressor) of toxin-antitoxin stability system